MSGPSKLPPDEKKKSRGVDLIGFKAYFLEASPDFAVSFSAVAFVLFEPEFSSVLLAIFSFGSSLMSFSSSSSFFQKKNAIVMAPTQIQISATLKVGYS